VVMVPARSARRIAVVSWRLPTMPGTLLPRAITVITATAPKRLKPTASGR